jgi:hypothetical protein
VTERRARRPATDALEATIAQFGTDNQATLDARKQADQLLK